MNAIELLKIVADYKVTVEVVNIEHIALDPIGNLPAELLDELKRCKRDIISYLTSQQQQFSPAVLNGDAYNHLPSQHARAMNGYRMLLQRKAETLQSRGYPEHHALVTPAEWRARVQFRLGLTYWEVKALEDDLIKRGALAYGDQFKNSLVEGLGVPLSDDEQSQQPECLHHGTGKDFRAWLYGSDNVH